MAYGGVVNERAAYFSWKTLNLEMASITHSLRRLRLVHQPLEYEHCPSLVLSIPFILSISYTNFLQNV